MTVQEIFWSVGSLVALLTSFKTMLEILTLLDDRAFKNALS